MINKTILLLTLLTLTTSSLTAGAGAYVRIFNFTSKSIDIDTKLNCFKNASSKEGLLTGSIAPHSAFPAKSGVYLEEECLLEDSDLDIYIRKQGSSKNAAFIGFDYKKVKRTFRKYKKTISSRNWPGDLYVYYHITDKAPNLDQNYISVLITENEISPSNWMEDLSDNTSLTSLLIPGTHDSGSSLPEATPYVQAQDLFISNQLKSGIRYLDLRGYADGKYSKAGIPFKTNMTCDMQVTHGAIRSIFLFSEIIDATINFLKKNEGETVFLQIKTDEEDPGYDHNKINTIMNCIIDGRKNYFYTKPEIPTLGDSRGKIVLINRYSKPSKEYDSRGINVTRWPNNTKSFDTLNYNIQDFYEKVGFSHNKHNAITSFLEATDNNSLLNFCFLSYTNLPFSLEALARGNRLLLTTGMNEWVHTWLINRPYKGGAVETKSIMIMDYVERNEPMINFMIAKNMKHLK